MKTIKAKQTIAGAYGVLAVDQTTEVPDKIADQLEKAGLAEIVGSGKEDAAGTSDSSVNITDNTGKEKKDVLVKDEKDKDAGPNSSKGADKKADKK